MNLILAHMTKEASDAIGVALLLIGIAILVVATVIIFAIVKLVKRWKL